MAKRRRRVALGVAPLSQNVSGWRGSLRAPTNYSISLEYSHYYCTKYTRYKVSLRDMPRRGVAKNESETIQNAYDTIIPRYTISAYYCTYRHVDLFIIAPAFKGNETYMEIVWNC